jgi:hypothetical protein
MSDWNQINARLNAHHAALVAIIKHLVASGEIDANFIDGEIRKLISSIPEDAANKELIEQEMVQILRMVRAGAEP